MRWGASGNRGVGFWSAGLGEENGSQTVFFLVSQLPPATRGVGERGVRGPRHPPAGGFGFCCWQSEGLCIRAEAYRAGPRFCFQPPYYLNQAEGAFHRTTWGPQLRKALPAGLPGDEGSLGWTDHVRRAPLSHAPAPEVRSL